MIGTEIHNYRITEKIGEGGMATVYKAVHKSMPAMVRAIKMMHPVLGIDAGIKAKFINEAEAMASLDHPNIVKIYDYEEQNGNLYLVMEYLEGMNLDELIRNRTGPMPEDRVVKIFSKVLDAIGYAHSKGIVHRDIKPSNIFIGANDEPKIIDFGIVKIMEDIHNPGRTLTGTVAGSPPYMSPEQILAKAVDGRSDIYSLGVTLFQMIAGQSPYATTTSVFEIQSKIVNEPLPRVREKYPAASDKMQVVIDKATAKNKEDRYQSCEEFKTDLNSKLVSRIDATQRVNPIEATQAARPSAAGGGKKSNASSIILILVLIGIAGFALFYFRDKIFGVSSGKPDSDKTVLAAVTKSYSGNIGKLAASYTLTWNTDKTITGTYYNPGRAGGLTYVLKGNDLGNGRIQLREFTGDKESARCELTLDGSCYKGMMHNTDGRDIEMTMCELSDQVTPEKQPEKKVDDSGGKRADPVPADGLSPAQATRLLQEEILRDHKVIDPRLIAKYIDAGADIYVSHNGWTALHYAAQKNNVFLLKKLIAKGVNINIRTQPNNTAIALAARENSIDAAELLLSQPGINLKTKNVDGNAPFDMAKTEEMRRLLRDHGARSAWEMR